MDTNIQRILGEGNVSCLSSDGGTSLSETMAWAVQGLNQFANVQTEVDVSKTSNQFNCASHNIDMNSNGVALSQNAPALEGPSTVQPGISYDNTPGLG